jgi:hypothetical protein
MDIVLAMAIFFVIVTAIFVAIAIFLPEWMGITGKKAKKIIEEQKEKPLPEKDSNDQH